MTVASSHYDPSTDIRQTTPCDGSATRTLPSGSKLILASVVSPDTIWTTRPSGVTRRIPPAATRKHSPREPTRRPSPGCGSPGHHDTHAARGRASHHAGARFVPFQHEQIAVLGDRHTSAQTGAGMNRSEVRSIHGRGEIRRRFENARAVRDQQSPVGRKARSWTPVKPSMSDSGAD